MLENCQKAEFWFRDGSRRSKAQILYVKSVELVGTEIVVRTSTERCLCPRDVAHAVAEVLRVAEGFRDHKEWSFILSNEEAP